MKHAYVFPGQGSQFSGMGKNLYESNPVAKELFEKANDILGFRISDVMFDGTDEELKQTNITQPAVFLHSVIAFCPVLYPLQYLERTVPVPGRFPGNGETAGFGSRQIVIRPRYTGSERQGLQTYGMAGARVERTSHQFL